MPAQINCPTQYLPEIIVEAGITCVDKALVLVGGDCDRDVVEILSVVIACVPTTSSKENGQGINGRTHEKLTGDGGTHH